ncbi:hypothetical protein LCGC14_0871980 [marine sediment metagenome]|uniref:Uncharacterized protein n=1 Tax=marine sediment metagenome TaxID=412755 RepID=A0A0F9PQ20_9ZZZZ
MPYKDKEKEKERNRRYQSTWYAKNRDKQLEQVRKAKEAKREWFNSLKLGLKCKQCGQDHPATLDFHHEDPNQKNFNLSCFMNMSKSSILTESALCFVPIVIAFCIGMKKRGSTPRRPNCKSVVRFHPGGLPLQSQHDSEHNRDRIL